MKYNKLKRKNLLKKPINNFSNIIKALIYLERNNREEDVDEIFYGVEIFDSKILVFFLLDDYITNNRLKDLNSKYYYALWSTLIKKLKGRNLIIEYLNKKKNRILKVEDLLNFIICNEYSYEVESGKKSSVYQYSNLLYSRILEIKNN